MLTKLDSWHRWMYWHFVGLSNQFLMHKYFLNWIAVTWLVSSSTWWSILQCDGNRESVSGQDHQNVSLFSFLWELLQAQLIAQSIGQAFSVAYQEFLRANGINPEDLSQKEYSDLLNTQDMYNDDLIHFSKSENCKEVCLIFFHNSIKLLCTSCRPMLAEIRKPLILPINDLSEPRISSQVGHPVISSVSKANSEPKIYQQWNNLPSVSVLFTKQFSDMFDIVC